MLGATGAKKANYINVTTSYDGRAQSVCVNDCKNTTLGTASNFFIYNNSGNLTCAASCKSKGQYVLYNHNSNSISKCAPKCANSTQVVDQ